MAIVRAARSLGHTCRLVDVAGWRRRLGALGDALVTRLAEGFRPDAVIFTRQAVRWVDVIVACAAVATVLSAVVLIHMLRFVPGGGGPMVYYLVACITACLASLLLMVVMRGLLLSAVAARAELDEVI